MDNKKIWDLVKTPPATALKPIQAGRLKGKHDINPQWRYEVITEIFGPCGLGWRYTIDKLWTEPGLDGQVFAFAQISFYHAVANDKKCVWSDPIPGIGGSMLLVKESSGIHHNDEAYKMAVTDALSVALKMLGVGNDVYRGFFDGSKYSGDTSTKPPVKAAPAPVPKPTIKDEEYNRKKVIYRQLQEKGISLQRINARLGKHTLTSIPVDEFSAVASQLLSEAASQIDQVA